MAISPRLAIRTSEHAAAKGTHAAQPPAAPLRETARRCAWIATGSCSELFFWLRPDFLLRCLRRFQALEGFDRAIALASSAFTAMIPLAILFGDARSRRRTARTRRRA